DGDPPQLAVEDNRPPFRVGSDGKHAAFHAQAPSAATTDRADDDGAAAVDVAVEQRMKSYDRIVVRGRRMHEVDDDAGLLALLATSDAADPLLVDALRSGGR